jgi:hypothetical protein
VEGRHPNHPGELSSEPRAAERLRHPRELEARARAIQTLQRAGIPFLVGGAYAFGIYTGIYRDTKDLDLFPRKVDALRALDVLAQDGWRTDRTNEVWIYKAFRGPYYVDLIFNSGNGVAEVDDDWFRHARDAEVFGQRVQIAAPEDMIWSKGFVLERERYDGADVLHLLRSTARGMDWKRLLQRFDRHWEVLFSHLLLFWFAYPSERTAIPEWVIRRMLSRTVDALREGDWSERICRGNLLSNVNYALDMKEWRYEDGRAWDEAERRREADARPELEDPRGSGR